jgi:hypothetical protein
MLSQGKDVNDRLGNMWSQHRIDMKKITAHKLHLTSQGSVAGRAPLSPCTSDSGPVDFYLLPKFMEPLHRNGNVAEANRVHWLP